MASRPSHWRRALRWLWIAGVVAAFAIALAGEWPQVRQALSNIAGWRVLLSLLLGLAGVGVSGQIWRTVLAGLGSSLSFAAAVRVFFVGQLGKYLPGSLWPVVAQMELGRDFDVPRRSSAAAVVIFLWVHLCSGVMVGALVLPLVGSAPPVVLLAIPIGAALLLPNIQSRVLATLGRVIPRVSLNRLPDLRSMFIATGWALVMWLLYGLHLWLLIGGMVMDTSTSSGSPVALVVGAFAAAWVAGFVVLIAPAGAGAREAALLALLPLAAGDALAVVVISRVLLTAADGLWGSVGALAVKRGRGHLR